MTGTDEPAACRDVDLVERLAAHSPAGLEAAVDELIAYLAECAGIPTTEAFAATERGQVVDLAAPSTPRHRLGLAARLVRLFRR